MAIALPIERELKNQNIVRIKKADARKQHKFADYYVLFWSKNISDGRERWTWEEEMTR